MELIPVTQANVKSLRRINQVVFPVIYNDKFYKDVLLAGELAKIAFYNDIVVGGVCCRIDTTNDQKRVYIMTLGCLASYRGQGIGTMMLQHVLSYAEKNDLDGLFLHVQINNEGAINFYKKFGFEIIDVKENYYKRIEPAAAYVLQKDLKISTERSGSSGASGNGNGNGNGISSGAGSVDERKL
ncbi:N-alpha-acetyltransferase 50-like [Panonychus citri]|uniref:N-alpha-acetyltransferase 50-like n=1 Tax=Panonychus citri TaxID=50023 RepID=UPI00230804B4|nr:N-alpha-acetyltransferase 50-like [Panonychus citri]